jgi:hypothetical protein
MRNILLMEKTMKRKIITSIILGLIIIVIISCSSSTELIATYIYETQSAWTIPPTYSIQPTFTYYPTYTKYPSVIKEVTKIIIITMTNTPSITLTSTPPPLLIYGYGFMQAYPNEDSVLMSYFDLDTGVNEGNENDDIEYTIGCGSDCFGFIYPINNAKAIKMGPDMPTITECIQRIPTFTDKENIIRRGEYSCVLTNSGNISIISNISSVTTNDNSTKIKIFYKTWKFE